MNTKLNTVEKAARVVAKNVFCVNQQHPPCDDCNVVGRVVCEDKGTTAVHAILTAWAADPPECMATALTSRACESECLGATHTDCDEWVKCLEENKEALRAAFIAARDEQGGGR